MTILLFILRELWLAKGRTALIVVVLASMAASLGGGTIAFDSLFQTRDDIYARLGYADLEIQTVPSSASELPTLEALRAVPGVTGVTRRFIAKGHAQIDKTGKHLPVVIHYVDPDTPPEVDGLEVLSGQFLRADSKEAVLVDRSFAAYSELVEGDRLTLNPDSFPSKFIVGGVALSPEYLVATANPDILIPSRGSLGVIYASRAKLDELFVDPLYNSFAFKFSPDVDASSMREAIVKEFAAVDIERAVTKESNFGYRYVEEILGGSRVFMPVTALIMAVIAAIVAFIAVQRLISTRMRELGMLLAMGYPSETLFAALLLFGLVPGLIGGVLSIPGSMLLGRSLAVTNATIPGFPPPVMQYAASTLVFAAATSLGVGLVSAIFPTLRLLRLNPAVALKGLGGAGTTQLASITRRLTSAGSTETRIAARNILRRPALSLSTVVLISLAVAMPAGLLSAVSSWNTWAEERTERLAWELDVSFKAPITAAQALAVLETPGLGDAEPVLRGYASLIRDGHSAEDIRVIGTATPSRLHSLDITSGRAFVDDKALEAVVNVSFSKDRSPPRVGESIVLRSGQREVVVAVVGHVSDPSLSTIYVPLQTAQRLLNQEGKFSGLYFTLGPQVESPLLAEARRSATPLHQPMASQQAEVIEIDESEFKPPTATPEDSKKTDPISLLLSQEIVSAAQSKSQTGKAMLEYVSSFKVIAVPFVGLGAVLAFLFLLCVLSFLLAERDTEYAVLQCLGYGSMRLATMIYVEVALLSALGLTASLASWYGMTYLLQYVMSVAWFWVPVNLAAADLVVVATPILFCLLGAAVPGVRGVIRMNLTTTLRARGIG